MMIDRIQATADANISRYQLLDAAPQQGD
jgi:hypothetical protein